MVFYSLSVTAGADPSVRPIAAALGVGLLMAMLLGGLIDAESARGGFFGTLWTIFPRLHRWSGRTPAASFVVCSGALGAAVLAVWLGPLGIKSLSIACDEARSVRIGDREEEHACQGAFSTRLWMSPMERYKPFRFACLDGQKNTWDGVVESSSSGICGKRPLDARYVTDGIDLESIDATTVVGNRTVAGAKRLRAALAEQLPDRRLKDRLLVATWNLRAFGRSESGWQSRMTESYAYISEVISHFDIVAIQEIHGRQALDRILDLLDGNYRAELGFFSPGRVADQEQVGFVFDTRKVALGDFSTTIVTESFGQASHTASGQPSRPPFLAEFTVNGRPILLVTTHIYFGTEGSERFERTLSELKVVGAALQDLGRRFSDRPVILAGDLNLPRADGPGMKLLQESGFFTTPSLGSMPSTYRGDRPYAQILALRPEGDEPHFGRTGVFNVFEHVYRDDEWPDYQIDFLRLDTKLSVKPPDFQEKRYRLQLRTYQISDHFPKWAEFRLDSAE